MRARLGKKTAFAAYPVIKTGEVCRLSIWIRKRQAREKSARELRAHTPRRAHPVLSALSIPEDAAGGCVRVMLLGSERALVENHLGVADVGREIIRLSTREGILSFHGNDLVLCDVRTGALSVRGQIERIEFPRGTRGEAARRD